MSEDRFGAIRETDDESAHQSQTDEDGTAQDQEQEPWKTPPYSQPTQRSIHAPDGDWNEYKDAINYEVDRVLAREFDIRNMKAYEADAAMVRLAAARPDLLAQFILAERGLEAESDEIEL
ncbi:MAG TPA: hypothetical protein VFJ06_01680 [Halococcus sp.]|nr:hypothetical protein [Halococcus sp.]